jgi:hypothetical protein
VFNLVRPGSIWMMNLDPLHMLLANCSYYWHVSEITVYGFLKMLADGCANMFRLEKLLQCWTLMFCFILVQKMVPIFVPRSLRWVENSSSLTWFVFFFFFLLLFPSHHMYIRISFQFPIISFNTLDLVNMVTEGIVGFFEQLIFRE